MPTQQHEVLVEMFRSQPHLAAGLITDAFGIPLPAYAQVRAASCDFTDVGPNEFRGDTALVLTDASGTAVVGIVLEVQLGRDRSRQWAWPVYVSTLRARLECPVFLMVVSPDARVATWCRKPIEFGHPGLVLRPLVLGPDVVPTVTDLGEARTLPERAVLSALAHADGPDADRVFEAFLAGLQSTDDERAKMYYDLVVAALSKTARHRLEELMTSTFKYDYQSDFARKYVAQGRAEEAVRTLLMVLEARGIAVPDKTRAEIISCTDLDRLESWTRKAATAESENDLFD
ncbi:hypothetical protein OHA40_25085 [Nocardia sp. NBC_00508]|uniref:hypothetical protein n=1 Tax=Nocardia sp. NBC_00508 TaxID=2975992 RepID=UPI002E804A0E|nr:hypothetical protein [Nocardia sp. NBC_00508]WUD64925.1 hypothetical protein OHA40_25085 [Nocardia sp. NBC_00508]